MSGVINDPMRSASMVVFETRHHGRVVTALPPVGSTHRMTRTNPSCLCYRCVHDIFT
jgi:hypothetical protein